MKDSERDLLFARARRAISPTDDNRRRVRAAIARKLAAGAVATVGATVTKAAAGGAPGGGAALVSASTLTLGKIVVGVVAVSAALSSVLSVSWRGSAVVPGSGGDTTAPGSAASPAPALQEGLVTVPVVRQSLEHTVASVASATLAPPPRPVQAEPVVHAPPRAPATERRDSVATLDVPPEPDQPVPPQVARPLVPALPPTSPSPSSVSAPVAADEAPAPAPDQGLVRAPHDGAPAAPPVAEARANGTAATETALVAEMQAALRDGDARRALALVAQHERLFPRSAWAPERAGARALALCAGADGLHAAQIGRAFLAAHPMSPLAGRIRARCRLNEP